MQIIKGRPVNYPAILKVFPLASNPGVIFAYAPDIYCPSGKPLPESLIAHEMVHIERQQAIGVELWWDKYLTDLQFRYIEELLAHRAEYDNLIGSPNAPRNVRRAAIKMVSKKLAAGLYGRMVTPAQAAQGILSPYPVGLPGKVVL